MNCALRMVLVFLCLGIPQIFAARVPPRLASQHEQFVPYWTAESGWHTEIELRNNLQQLAMVVKTDLRLSDGTAFRLADVTIPANDVKVVELGQALASAAPQLVGHEGAFGSLVFRYNSFSTSNLYASAMIHLDGHPIEYHVDAFHVTATATTADYDGMWWAPQPSAKQFLVLGNYAKEQAKARISIFNDAGFRANTSDFSLNPGQTVRVDLQDEVRKAGVGGTFGGLSLHCSNAVAIFPFQFIYDESSGFSALMKMHRHYPDDKPSLVTLRAAMMALSNPDPALRFPSGTTLTGRVFLRNTTNQNLPVDVSANWRSQTGSAPTHLGIYILRPEQTTLLDLSGMQKNGRLPVDANWAGVSVQFDGREGDLMAISSSYDASWQHGLQSPFTAQLSGLWEGGMWHADTLENSLITTGNGGTKPTAARVRINFHGGSYEIKSKTLAPGEQLWIDVGDLKQRQMPDEKGNVIPLFVTSGTYEIEDMSDANLGSLFEGKLTVDKTFGHAAYGCASCCGDDLGWLDPNPLATAVGAGAQDDLWGTNACTGLFDLRTSTSFSWSSSNTGVATMGPGKGWVNGISAGTSNVTGYFQSRLDDGFGSCKFQNVPGGGVGNVKPKITGQNTLWWFNGQDPAPSDYPTSVTLSSSGGPSTTWTVPAGAARVHLSATTGAQTIVTSTGTHFSGAQGDISIQATINNQSSDPFTMTAKTVWKLVARQNPPPTQCFSSPTNYITTVSYDLHDNFDSVMSTDVGWNEVLGAATSENGSNWGNWPPVAMGAATNPLDDLVGAPDPHVNPTMHPLPTCTGQNNGTTRFMAVPQTIKAGTTGSGGIQVQTDTLGYYTDHGQHDSKQVPAKPPS